jgi:hypothetical protein|uniref:Uncharacterized protein n=1 Tax=viral metagenome TaxID=1070528 RepID=A0A6C0AVS2_9ZZZZ|tara:strand:+ start:2862 stop:3575 length:714 start_codon:yes stop_codon:yes gene_type:complete
MDKQTLVFWFFRSLIALVLILIIHKMLHAKRILFWKKSSSEQQQTLIEKTTRTAFKACAPNMKCIYKMDLRVFYTGSSRDIHIICDRQSPVIKLDMGTGRIIIDYLAAVNQPTSAHTDTISEPAEVVSVDSSGEIIDTCVCPTDSSGNKANPDDPNDIKSYYPTTMRVATPSIPFQRLNHIEIHQDLREIDILVNGDILYSAMLEYVPFLYPGKATLLPKEAWRYMNLDKVSFTTDL